MKMMSSKTKLPKPTNTSTNAWEKLPRKLQQAITKRKVKPLLLVGGDELFFAEITEDNEILVKVNNTVPVTGTFFQATQPVSIATMPSTPVTGTFWQTTQPVSGSVDLDSGAAVKITDGTDSPNVSGDALHTKRVHSDGLDIRPNQTTAFANNTASTLQTYSPLHATLDQYITRVTLVAYDAAAFLNAAGETIHVMISNTTSPNSIHWFCDSASFGKGDTSALNTATYRVAKTWNFGSPIRIAANSTVTVWVINSSGNSLNGVYVHIEYYLE